MIIRNPKQIVLDELNAKNSLNLTLGNVTFVNVHVPTTDEEILYAKGKNTMATLVAGQGAPGLGKTPVFYNRLPITTLFVDYGKPGECITLAVDFATCKTSRDLVPTFVHFYGIDITPEDISNIIIDEAKGVVKFEFLPGSPGFTGEILVRLIPGDPQLAPNFPNNTANDVYEYPYFNTKVGQAPVYSYGYVFDDYAHELKGMKGSESLDRLAQILSVVTNHPWERFRLPNEYNLREAKIIYNGPNRPEFKSNPLAENVLVIELSLYCINFGGQMILHYADPA